MLQKRSAPFTIANRLEVNIPTVLLELVARSVGDLLVLALQLVFNTKLLLDPLEAFFSQYCTPLIQLETGWHTLVDVVLAAGAGAGLVLALGLVTTTELGSEAGEFIHCDVCSIDVVFVFLYTIGVRQV